MWEKILISDRKSKKRKPTTDLITRKDTSHPAQNLKWKRRKKKETCPLLPLSSSTKLSHPAIRFPRKSRKVVRTRLFGATNSMDWFLPFVFIRCRISVSTAKLSVCSNFNRNLPLFLGKRLYDLSFFSIYFTWSFGKIFITLLQLFARGFETFDRQCTFSTNEVGRNNEQWGNILEKRPNKIPPRSTGQTLIFSRVKRGRYRKETDKLEESPSGNFVTMEYLKVPLSLSFNWPSHYSLITDLLHRTRPTFPQRHVIFDKVCNSLIKLYIDRCLS